MILGKLFKKIFDEKIKVVFSSNIDIDELYKDGLQRDQFIPWKSWGYDEGYFCKYKN